MTKTIYDYQNYRHFLMDYLNENVVDNKKITQREILKQMGVTSSGFLANVLSGRNNLTTTLIASLVRVLKLKKAEASYFEAMTLFTQAKSLVEKSDHYMKMVKITKAKFKKLKPEQLCLFAQWHYPVIRDLLDVTSFEGDFKALAKMVEPSISSAEAKDAIKELERIGLIYRNVAGIYKPKDGTISTGDEIRSFHVSNFILSTLKKAVRALDRVPSQERDMSVLTMKLSDSKMKEVKMEIQLFRKRLLRIVEDDTLQDRVYQCNINFFPVSKKGA